MPESDGGLWQAVDGLLARATTLDGLRAHGLHLLAARRLRRLGEPVPEGLAYEERGAAAIALLAPLVLAAAREAYDGELVVVKGPEVAALYPLPATRPFTDIDLLAADAAAAHRALRRAGFVEIGDPRLYEDIHHLRPLVLPDVPLPVELHARPKWVAWHAGPTGAELVRAAVPGTSGVEGVLALPPAHHALLLAAHSWAHEPLRRVLDLVDVRAVAASADPAELDGRAREWGLTRVWTTTERASAALLAGARRPLSTRLWARDLAGLRERTVLETHLESWFAPYAALAPHRAAQAMLAAVAADVRRDHGDSWWRKLRRSRQALANAFRPRSYHDRVLDEVGANAALSTEREHG
jgi:hypothetical protein